MQRTPRWLRTDEKADAEGSLRKAADTAPLVKSDLTQWKWLLITLHAATQGVFVLALARGNGLLTLKTSHAKKWLKAYQSGGPPPPKLDLEYFLELYAKAKALTAKRSLKITDGPAHDQAMKRLNDLRNDFIHFGPRSWSIELIGLPDMCLRCLEFLEHLGWNSGLVKWTSIAQSRRARRALRTVRRNLVQLDREYQR